MRDQGLEEQTLKRMSEVLGEELPVGPQQVFSILGPSHAEEVSRRMPTSIVVAGVHPGRTERIQGVFIRPYLRVYTNSDVIGVEMAVALKNSIVPTLTVMGLLFAYSITGAVLVEIVFTWPGMGSYMTDAILNSDIYVLFGVTLVVTIIYIAVNLLVDLIQAALDPRIRLGKGGEA